MDYINSYNTVVNNALSPLDKPVFAGLLKLIVVLYGAVVAAQLQEPVLKYFNFVPFKILVLAIIVWLGNHDPALSIIIAVAFFISVNVFSGKKAFEAFKSREHVEE